MDDWTRTSFSSVHSFPSLADALFVLAIASVIKVMAGVRAAAAPVADIPLVPVAAGSAAAATATSPMTTRRKVRIMIETKGQRRIDTHSRIFALNILGEGLPLKFLFLSL